MNILAPILMGFLVNILIMYWVIESATKTKKTLQEMEKQNENLQRIVQLLEKKD